jgi:hypothetical protein
MDSPCTSFITHTVYPYLLSKMASNDVAKTIRARHVITPILHSCLLRQTASYDAASTSMMDSARNVITHTFDPFYDVASTVHQALRSG